MSTWTLEHAKRIVAAWPEVEQYYSKDNWRPPITADLHAFKMECIGNPEIFRLPPKKRLVEWTAEDVKPGMVFRRDSWDGTTWQNFHAVGSKGIFWDQPCREITHWRELIDNGWQWSMDAVTWHPCARQVES